MAVIVSACARKEIKLHAVSYNKAISDYGNKQILLNAVRAGKRYPMYFSAVGDMVGGGMLSGNIQKRFPFSITDGTHIELPSFDVDPRVDYNSGLTSVNIGNLNTKEFQEGLFKEVDNKIFKQFLDNNWPKGVLFNVFVHKITMGKTSDRKVSYEVERHCNRKIRSGEDSRTVDRCLRRREDFSFIKEHCHGNFEALMDRRGRYFNAGDHECDQRMFQIFVSELRILGFDFGSEPVPGQYSEKKKTETKSGSQTLESVVYSERTDDTSELIWKIGSKFRYLGALDIKIELRSPYAMIQYLGALIRAQLLVDDRFTPTIVYGGDFVRVPLFVVRRGILGKAVSGAISVRHEGSVYYIPRPHYGDRYEDRSLQVLDLINQVIIQQTKKTDLPKSSTIQLIGN